MEETTGFLIVKWTLKLITTGFFVYAFFSIIAVILYVTREPERNDKVVYLDEEKRKRLRRSTPNVDEAG